MLRSARVITVGLLVAVFASLAVPLGFAVVPVVVRSLEQPEPIPEPPADERQLPPVGLTPPAQVAALDPAAPLPNPALLTSALHAELRFEGSGVLSGVVVDAASGDVLFDDGSGNQQLPASNQKLLTAAAVMSKLDPGRRFETTVVAGELANELVLVAGGDVLLSSGESDSGAVVGHAGLQSLAEETVDALDPADGPFNILLDDTLFIGPTLNAGWLAGDVNAGEIAPIYPLAINSSWRDEAASRGPRSPDAALHAAAVFREAVVVAGSELGVEVGAEVIRSPALDGDAIQLAGVESATVEQQVEHMLLTSDNYLAETLARLAARASGQPASFGGATETIESAVGQLEVPGEGLVVSDAAGLSPRNEVSPAQLAALVRALAVSEEPGLVSILNGLPIAGLSGTLQDRYELQGPAASGAGLVRAKTGTLNAVTALTGYVVTTDGRLLVFSFMAGGLDGNTVAARTAIDRAAAALARCGCR
ncbi:D-alanyl-D-alanine carboxypeptidase/D-alanyl-D-alanine-endopeptidase [Arthrobacter sp. H20]|uniref:D-alanyl-D-alanine carboxypeptidase/D-alanyl-D-alanine endopeptidase n=1 Tax=Arthrobacter sp. H20 TaxID=1267981 RepID=UPI0004B2EBDC|nr:D-alanyl-D-alanine carboxypeptidase/D-alanyl-D-alanine-endopeptidase [Arthrobacter sp. H20]